jgi:hypothetical protein
MANQWWVVEYTVPRTGVKQVDYTEAPSKQAASELNPGTTVVMGPYATEQDAEDAYNGSAAGKAYNANPHSPKSSGVNGPASTTNQNADKPPSWLGFLGDLTDRSTWLRVLEAVVGVGLVLVAVSHLASSTETGKTIIATGKRAAEAAALA